MPKETYGEPQKSDATARYDRIIARATERAARIVRERGPSLLNRPIGSKTISDIDQFQDYLGLRDNPQIIQQRFQERAQQIGPSRAAAEMIEWAHKNEMTLRRATERQMEPEE